MAKSYNNKVDCSIVILNYFGEKVIEATIESVLKLNFPKNRLEIIIVDNNSKDNSRTIIDKIAKKNKNLVKKIYLDKNVGFANGNNHGIKIAKGKYIALLNNDCIVDKNWLKELYMVAQSDESIFSVSSKIILFPKYFNIEIPTIKNFQLHEVILSNSNLLNFYKEKKLAVPFVNDNINYQIELPIDIKHDKKIGLTLVFNDSNKVILKDIKKFYSKFFKINEIKKEEDNKYIISCEIKKKLLKNYIDKIQNAGSIVFQDGYARDIGAVIKYQSQNYENDQGQYEVDKKVYATCGAAVLYNKKILSKIGLLDDTFFMYYEDIEICTRAKILGFICVYCHKAVARHLHAQSSKEWSPFFVYNVERGRLLHLYYTFPEKIFLKEFIKFFILSHLKFFRSILNKNEIVNSWQNIKVLFDFSFNFFKYRNNKISKKLNKKDIHSNYDLITSGHWYFN